MEQNISAELDDQVARVRDRLERSNPYTRIVSLLPSPGWQAAVADRHGTAHLVRVRYLAAIEPIHMDYLIERRLVAVIETDDGRWTLDADVRGLVYVDDDRELRELGEDLLRAADHDEALGGRDDAARAG